MPNSWVDAQNAKASAWNALQRPGNGTLPQYMGMTSEPTDMSAFRQNFGGGYANEADYNNWRSQQQRTNTLADFVNQMATPTAASTANTARVQGDASKYGGNVDAYLNSASPTMATSNRFDTGLSDAERRLQSLLDNPDSINQSAAYKFRVGQGQEALQRSLGAKGLLNSGNRLMELTKYGQDMASQEYGNQADRLSGLLSSYGQGYLGDRAANTAEFGAKSNAWAQRGGLLKDLYSTATTAANQDMATTGNDRVGFANAWVNQAPKPLSEYETLANGTIRKRIG